MKGCLSMFPFLVSHVFKIIPYFAMQLYAMTNGKCLGLMGYGGFFSFRGILYYFIFELFNPLLPLFFFWVVIWSVRKQI